MLRKIGFAALVAICPTWAAALDVRVSSNALADDVRGVSLVAPLSAKDATPQDILAAAQADYARIVGLMYDRGYFAPVVSIRVGGREASDIAPIAPPSRISRVDIKVQTGPLFRFGRAQIAPLPSGVDVPEGFRKGQTATTGAIRKAAEVSVDGWRNVGHAKAAVTGQQITARHAERRLDADLTVSPGPRLHFGALRINGNEAMRTDRIRDIAGLPTGQVFDPEELERSANRLRRTGVFSVVALSEADKISQGDILDIDTQFVEAKPRRFGFGAELSSQQGVGVNAFWLHRNLLGGGERLRVSGEIGGIGGQNGGVDYAFALNFGRPATFNEDTDFYAAAEIERLDEPNLSTNRASIEAGIRRYASDTREYTFGLGLESAETTTALGTQSYTIFTLPASAEFDERDDRLDAMSGYYARASVTPFVSISGTDNGLVTELDLRTYKQFGPSEKLTFALRGQLGSVAGPALADAPADFLFYSGGGGSVRGQEFQSLGVDQGGTLLGGRSFLGLSGEIRVKTSDKLSVVGFLDAGYVGSEAFPDGSSGNWHSGAGFGVRYDTGIGPVRVDLAVPLSGPGPQLGFEIYIGLGQAF